MRRLIDFDCMGARLSATLDEGPGVAGLLIVSGGNEIRIGAHRGMALLAQDVAAAGFPVFRFDRRGIGDSEGANGGFRTSGPDIAAALSAFRAACPDLTHVVAFGNCDAATALVIHETSVAARVLANPWIVETVDALPPAAAIKDRYARRLRDPKAWAALLSGKIDLKAAARGLGRIAMPSPPQTGLADTFANAVANCRTTIMLAARDNTAIAFADAWNGPMFDHARKSVRIEPIDSASHSFASETDYDLLKALLLQTLSG